MNAAILIGIILTSTVATFTTLIIYKHVQDVLAWRDEALMAYKQVRRRQELVEFVCNHR